MLTREQLIDRLIQANAERFAWRRMHPEQLPAITEADQSQARVVVEAALTATHAGKRDALWNT